MKALCRLLALAGSAIVVAFMYELGYHCGYRSGTFIGQAQAMQWIEQQQVRERLRQQAERN